MVTIFDISSKPLLVVAGPTASGKTALGVRLAQEYGGEVVSADSMQIYKGMDIATAKPASEEMCGIPHHLIGILDRNVNFSVAEYIVLAKNVIDDIHSRGKLPILVGGTGLYISSLVDNINFEEIKSDGKVRIRLSEEAAQFGNEVMLEKLSKIDPETAVTLHPNNLTRIIRALEVFELTGITLSEQKRRSRMHKSEYATIMLGLNFDDRSILYDRINRRVDIMLSNGLLEEAKKIFQQNSGGITANQAIGYKELIPYFEGDSELNICIDKIKQETRHYAKRQLTWFRRDERINWIICDDNTDSEKNLKNSKNIIAKQKII